MNPTETEWAVVQAAAKLEADDGWAALIDRYITEHPEKAAVLKGLPMNAQVAKVQGWIKNPPAKFAAGIDRKAGVWSGY